MSQRGGKLTPLRTPWGLPGLQTPPYAWVFNTWFLSRPEVVDFGGLGGPGGLQNHSKRWGFWGPPKPHKSTISRRPQKPRIKNPSAKSPQATPRRASVSPRASTEACCQRGGRTAPRQSDAGAPLATGRAGPTSTLLGHVTPTSYSCWDGPATCRTTWRT